RPKPPGLLGAVHWSVPSCSVGTPRGVPSSPSGTALLRLHRGPPHGRRVDDPPFPAARPVGFTGVGGLCARTERESRGFSPERIASRRIMLTAFDNGRLFGAVSGTKPPWVLALHGWRRTHQDFDAVIGAVMGNAVVDALALDL